LFQGWIYGKIGTPPAFSQLPIDDALRKHAGLINPYSVCHFLFAAVPMTLMIRERIYLSHLRCIAYQNADNEQLLDYRKSGRRTNFIWGENRASNSAKPVSTIM